MIICLLTHESIGVTLQCDVFMSISQCHGVVIDIFLNDMLCYVFQLQFSKL